MSESAKDLFACIFVKNPEERLGSKNPEDLKNHEFFHGIDWVSMYKKTLKPPYIPRLDNDTDLKHFDEVRHLSLTY
jgi:hypothetical protein